ncbi:hypothetical protein [Microlunatus sp. GCM10028923]|uniref:hypothetical protein n=1 Tax=Microlunatus sp. GCM10028923 TaxID=3273400 RepID=UPI00361E1426
MTNVGRDVTGAKARGLARKILQRGKQAKAVLGIGAALAMPSGVPQTPAAQIAAQSKDFSKYATEVRLPATDREITKTLRAATRMKLNGPAGLTRRDRRELR